MNNKLLFVMALLAAIMFSGSASAFCGPQDPFKPYDHCGPHQRYNGGGIALHRSYPVNGPGTSILASIRNPYPETGLDVHVAYTNAGGYHHAHHAGYGGTLVAHCNRHPGDYLGDDGNCHSRGASVAGRRVQTRTQVAVVRHDSPVVPNAVQLATRRINEARRAQTFSGCEQEAAIRRGMGFDSHARWISQRSCVAPGGIIEEGRLRP